MRLWCFVGILVPLFMGQSESATQASCNYLTTEFILPDKTEKMRTCYPVINEPNNEDFTIERTQYLTPALFIQDQPNVKFLPTNLNHAISELIVIRVWNCSVTSVNEKHFKGLSNLRTLSLFHNKIENIASDTFLDLVNLEFLDLDDNRLHFVGKRTFAPLKALKKLNLDINEIHFIHPEAFSALANVELINLSRNVISSLDESIFHGMVNLKKLFLTNNPLERIHKNLFQTNLKLTDIRLENNKIGFIDMNVFDHLTSLHNVDLRSNKCVKRDYFSGKFDEIYKDCNNGSETQSMDVHKKSDIQAQEIKELKSKYEAMNLGNKALQNVVDKMTGQNELTKQKLDLIEKLLEANYEVLNRRVDALNGTLQNVAPEFEG